MSEQSATKLQMSTAIFTTILQAISISTTTIVAATAAYMARNPKTNKYTVTTMDWDALSKQELYGGWFERNLRCSQYTFSKLLAIIQPIWFAEYGLTNYRQKIKFDKILGMNLYHLGSSGGYRETAHAFGVSKGSVIKYVSLCIDMIVKHRQRWICLPSTPIEWERVQNGFRATNGIFSQAIGCIDGSLFPIERPKDYEVWYCRKGYPAINMQALVDPWKRFISFDMRPGSWSDSKIWNISRLGSKIQDLIPQGCYIIGDSAYTLAPYMITPYLYSEEGGYLTNKQADFNFYHSSRRMVVEIAFGWLKNRWRILKLTLAEKTITKSTKIIVACMVFHNLLIDEKDNTIPAPDAVDLTIDIHLPIRVNDTNRRELGKVVRDKLSRRVQEFIG